MNTTCLLTIIALLSASCCFQKSESQYSHQSLTIKRVDNCDRTIFTCYKNGKHVGGEIWVEYSGINDGFSGYLKFNPQSVILLSGDGHFQMSDDLDTAVFNYRRILAHERPILGGTTFEILLSTELESERNQTSKSIVQAQYGN